MEEELRQMREEMAQLRAENERLSNLVANVRPPAQSEHGEHSNAAASVSDVASPPRRTQQTVYLPRERKCPKFSGSGTLTVDEWVEEVESCLRTRHMSELDKALFLYDHLEGTARLEIKFREQSVKGDVKQIIAVLQELYGCSKSYVFLQQKFFDRKQKEGESLQDYSHALMTLMEQVKACNPQAMSNPQALLRDQFCENVKDHMLRRELKRMVRQNEQLSMIDIRKEAIRWVEEGQSTRDKYVRPLPQTCEAQATATSEAVGVEKPELIELKNMLLAQQAQLDEIKQSLHSNTRMARGRGRPVFIDRRFQRAPDGRPICVKCMQPGHIARYCTQTDPQPPQTNTATVQATHSEN